MVDVRREKALVRERILEQRESVSDYERRKAGKAIYRRAIRREILLHPRVRVASIYLSSGNEVPTRYIARALWATEREVCVPVWNRTKRSYDLSMFYPYTQLIEAHHGIREPEIHIPVQPQEVDAFIVPGLAFDTYGGRLGYGAGYYDRILGQCRAETTKIAVCYDWQLQSERLPQSEHDIRVDWVVTDKRVVRCGRD